MERESPRRASCAPPKRERYVFVSPVTASAAVTGRKIRVERSARTRGAVVSRGESLASKQGNGREVRFESRSKRSGER
jgi:hypothetical protein